MSGSKVRLRFAPSPTGHLHLGGARTALINYLFAENQGGDFIIRIEDTDSKRGDVDFLKSQLKDLKWLKLKWSEGLDSETLKSTGPFGPYQQSLRGPIYKKYAETLIQQNKAYYCFLSDEEITAQKKKALELKKPLRVVSPYREQDIKSAQKKISEGQKAVVRFKNPQQKKIYTFQDLVRGKVQLPSDMVGDFVILRSTGEPVYNFSCVIDDHLMNISHVFRSEEHLANTLRQLMIYEAFSWNCPEFAHLSIILSEDRKKLSKRTHAVSVSAYRKQGFLPSALLNFLSLMGWNPKTTKEVFSLKELVREFSLKGLNASPGVFDIKKLKWINAQHIKNMSDQELSLLLLDYFKEEDFQFPDSKQWFVTAVKALRASFSTFKEAKEVFSFLSVNHFQIDKPTVKEVFEWESTLGVLKQWEIFLKNAGREVLSAEDFAKAVKSIQQKTNVKGKKLFMPIRCAVLGRPSGAELKVVIPLINRSVLLKRVDLCRKLFSS